MKHTLSLLTGLLLLAAVTPTAHAASVTFGTGVNQFMMEFVPIGNPGNAADTTGLPNPAGSVGYAFQMGKFEVSEDMIDKANAEGGLGITKDTRGPDKPATTVNWFEAATFVNWLNTSQGFQAAYNFDGSGNFQFWSAAEAFDMSSNSNPGSVSGPNLYRHKDAQYFLPSVDEWYKAAYYDGDNDVYYDYPTGSDSVPDGIDSAGDTTFDVVFFDGGSNPDPNDITDAGVLSPYGTMGQGGNVFEWEETALDLTNDGFLESRGLRGGAWDSSEANLRADVRSTLSPSNEGDRGGFRVAAVPEPSGALLGLVGLCGGLLRRRRRSASH